ncbi:MAG: glycoside hydrolase family 15 protein [Bacteroidota bacterium]
MAYYPIDDYGIIGNMKTAALVSKHGTIDWLCYPYFDSPSVFASILDEEKGGQFSIQPSNSEFTSKQFYWQDTNILVTRFINEDGAVEILDYMPVGDSDLAKEHNCLVRRIHVLRGNFQLNIYCHPAFDYARAEHELTHDSHAYRFSSDDLSMSLLTKESVSMKDGAVDCQITLKEGDQTSFIWMETAEEGDKDFHVLENKAFNATIQYWRKWLSQCTYTGRWRETVYRSALTLKLMTFEPTGAIIAALTSSLPGKIGGTRNWDYRYTWIRDAAFTVYAFMRIGFTEEAMAFMKFIEERVREREEGEPLQIVFSIHGERELVEKELDHLSGYKDSSPVRIGNGAYDQLQLDIYGELMDSVYLSNKYGSAISYDFWKELRKIVNWNADNWQRKDAGIWEIRDEGRHFVYSKLMSWVAMDRALRLADKRSFPADREKWLKTRDEIYEEILEHGWNEDINGFTQSYDGKALDASNLLMTMTFFMSPNDPKMLKTLDSVDRPLSEGGLIVNDLVFRYDVEHAPDGIEGDEGTFNICTFWMVEALARAGEADTKYLERSRMMFEHMLSYANHLGLYAEQTGVRGESLGNFPQAFSHLALISAAYNLDKALSKK